VCPEGRLAPRGRLHCNDLRSEHRYSVIAARPPNRDRARVLLEDLPASLADACGTRQQKKLLSRVVGSPLGAHRRRQLLHRLAWSSRTGSSRRKSHRRAEDRSGHSTVYWSGLALKHLLSVARETTSRPSGWAAEPLKRSLPRSRRGVCSRPTCWWPTRLRSLSFSHLGRRRICSALVRVFPGPRRVRLQRR